MATITYPNPDRDRFGAIKVPRATLAICMDKSVVASGIQFHAPIGEKTPETDCVACAWWEIVGP